MRDVGNVKRRLLVDDAAGIRRRRPRVPLDDVDALHEDARLLAQHAEDLAGLALLLAGDDDHLVALPDLELHSHSRTLPPARLQHFRRQRDDLHEILGPQLARHRTEDAGADRLALLVDQHGRVAVEADRAAVRPPDLLRRAHDHRLMHVALLDAAPRDRILDRHDDDVADAGVLPLRAAEHLDALHAAGARIVGDLKVRLHLDHGLRSFLARRRPGLGHDFPALALGDRAALADTHRFAHLVDVVLVVRRVLLRAADELLVDRVHDPALDLHDDGLVHLVAHDDALQNTPRHIPHSYDALCALSFNSV